MPNLRLLAASLSLLSLVMSPLLLMGACAPANYLYSFDLTDPGAINYVDFRRPDAFEDADVKLEVRADPGEFHAVAIDFTNKTDQPLQPQWDQISIVGPDQQQRSLHTQTQASIDPGAKVQALLTPFELPTQGPEARSYDGTTFELFVPVIVRGNPRPYRLHLHVTLKKI